MMGMERPPLSIPPTSPFSAEEVLAAFLAEHPSPSLADIDALCAEHTGHQDDLRRLVAVHEAMLAAVPAAASHDSPGLHRSPGLSGTPAVSGFRVKKGMVLGDFDLVRILGRGGMGEVWEAEQKSLSRRVALKLLLPERVDSKGLEFFAREARAGGRLAHAGIVSIHGTGENEGLHWIAMEMVEGACDLRRSLEGIRERSELSGSYHEQCARFLADAAEAMEVAHAAGVIHRDLKPSNILITPDNQPKISDFGLAKLTDERSISAPGDLAGTYLYMSPEQVTAKRMGLDHRTDVFSLGVVMYEMLTLVRPFEGDTSEQVAHKILLEDPPPPNQLRSKVPQDLSVICGRAMEKDPDKRYGSMTEFAADLRRYLTDQPILARPPGPVDRAVKWVRRNPTPTAVIGVAAVALVMISWLGLTAWDNGKLATRRAESLEVRRKELAQANSRLKAQREEAEAQARIAQENAERARKARARAERVLEYQIRTLMPFSPRDLGRGLLSGFEAEIATRLRAMGNSEEQIHSKVATFHDLALLAEPTDVANKIVEDEIMSLAAVVIGDEFGDDPQIEATLREALGDLYYHPLALLDQAVSQYEQTVALRREVLGNADPETLHSIGALGAVLRVQDKLDVAAPLLLEALSGKRRILGDEDPETLASISDLGCVLLDLGRLDEAESLLLEAVEVSSRIQGERHAQTVNYKSNLGRLLAAQGKFAEAEALLRAVLATQAHSITSNSSLEGYLLGGLGEVVMSQGRFPEAELLLREAVAKMHTSLGTEHWFSLQAMSKLGNALLGQGKVDEAESALIEALGGFRRTLGDAHPDTQRVKRDLEALLERRKTPSALHTSPPEAHKEEGGS